VDTENMHGVVCVGPCLNNLRMLKKAWMDAVNLTPFQGGPRIGLLKRLTLSMQSGMGRAPLLLRA
jgi:hypothetical protein